MISIRPSTRFLRLKAGLAAPRRAGCRQPETHEQEEIRVLRAIEGAGGP